MNSQLAASITNFVEIHHFFGYVLLFIGVMIEGEAILLIFSFLASQGFFRIEEVALISFFGVIMGNNIWYKIGKQYGQRIIDKFGKYIPRIRLNKIQASLKEHNWKYIFFSKFIYGLNHLVIMAAGHAKEDAKKIMKIDALSTVLWIIIVSGIGYSFGYALKTMRHFLREITVAAMVLLIIFIFAEKFIKKIFIYFSEKNDN